MLSPILLPAFTLLVACIPMAAQQVRPSGPPRIPGKILVSAFNGDALHTYRAWDGAPGDSFAVSGPQCIVRGPDRFLYVCAEKVDEVLRVDPISLEVVGTFVGDNPITLEDENGSLDGPTAATFGPEGDLFVASFETDEILRFDGTSGAYEGVFVSAGLGGLDGPDAGTKFGQDGLLYVPSFWNDRVLRYDAQGEFVDEFVSFREGNLRQPRDLVQRDGDWFVASSLNDRILRFDSDGNFLGIFARINSPYCLAFHPLDRDLYVVNSQNNSVRVFDGKSGVFREAIVSGGSGGLSGAVYLFFLD